MTHALERKRVSRLLAESGQRFRALVAALSHIVWRTDAQGNVVEVNGWAELTGSGEAVHDRPEAMPSALDGPMPPESPQ